MEFKKPPKLSKNTIRRAEKILIHGDNNISKLEQAMIILNEWRACHAYPINTFEKTLQRKQAKGILGNQAIIAQRLKRSSTIIEKLRELRNVGLLNMQDIAGVRAIVSSIDDVYRIKNDYENSKRLKHELDRVNDYIENPKPDGYRGIHLVYKYKNSLHPDWDGLLIEVQIRTRLQHNWATAVEAIKFFYQHAVKARPGQNRDKDWTDFFALLSSAFACIEGKLMVAEHRDLSRKELLTKIKQYEKKLEVRKKLTTLGKAVKQIFFEEGAKSSLFLVILDLKKRTVDVKRFSRDESDQASTEYAEAEANYKDREEIEPVLVSTMEGYLEYAYASFFLRTDYFRDNLDKVLSGKWTPKQFTESPSWFKKIVSRFLTNRLSHN
jgi:putative GTP pyrophosphokinase